MEIGYLAAFLGGVLTLVAPCSALLLPAFFAYAFTSPRVLVSRTFALLLGILAVTVPMGAFAATLGGFIRAHTATIATVLGVLVLLFGVAHAFAVSLPTPAAASRLMARGTKRDGEKAPSILAVFALGAGYSLAAIGCSGPILGAVLAGAAWGGSTLTGVGLMVCFSLGMALPIGVLAWLWEAFDIAQKGWLRPRPVQVLGRSTTWLNLISGIIFALLGLVLIFTGGQINLPSLLDSSTQVAWETRILAVSKAVPTWVFPALLALFAIYLIVRLWGKHSARKQTQAVREETTHSGGPGEVTAASTTQSRLEDSSDAAE
ncbi:cytochrome c biogenesis CcdA family protein [Gleimia hominis]|uniref:cytochrome c biogenesis CcdA family protein n=1 Tax=Gleimia hominis TaxID=595468 RepID=UPI000C809977|nr:cytochrome c biogenesis CcdA family protein [Gleimia hominis]WIK64085.1 cytochrome c biogenesis CcdA family protein [Gleimia hominis]